MITIKNINIEDKIGFIQGRLSKVENDRIQIFPIRNWESEFQLAKANNIKKIEWTIDSETISGNPLVNSETPTEISEVMLKHDIQVPSVTCDYFMERPPWQNGAKDLELTMIKIINGMRRINSTKLIIPLVDNSSLSVVQHEISLVNFFELINSVIVQNNIQICFESDFSPKNLARFIGEFPNTNFGINYDIGNSASLGFLPKEEIETYGNRILNVHVKDRLLRGKTVPLGEGAADFEAVFKHLKSVNYEGNYILQTARATDDNHLGVLLKYRSMVTNWVEKNE
jgi:L-ribulose-5-phosphate 3-epimerase